MQLALYLPRNLFGATDGIMMMNFMPSTSANFNIETKATIKERLFRVLVTGAKFEVVPSWLRVMIMRGLGCRISRDVKAIWANGTFKSSKLIVGDNVFINSMFYHDGMEYLTIGRNVAIGPNVTVITGSHKIGSDSSLRCSLTALKRPVVIEEGCWIGARTTILPGVIVARGCVIGAQSLLVRSTEPDGVYVGSPARRVRDLT